MATKRQRRSVEVKTKKQKKKMKKSFLFVIVSSLVGFWVFMFLTLFDYVYPPVDGKGFAGKKRDKQAVVLYFSDPNERFLMPEKRFVPKEENVAAQGREIVKALIDGSKTGLINTFPEKVDVHDVKVDKETAYVDFGRQLTKLHPGGSASEMATIYSLTNTLTENLPGVKQVKILIGGKEIPSIKGHIDTRQPFVPNRELIVQSSKEG